MPPRPRSRRENHATGEGGRYLRRHFLWRRDLWIALILVAFNGLAWLGAAPITDLPEFAPRLDPQIADFRDRLFSGEQRGEAFTLTITDQMASESIAWFLARHPEVPFSHPQVLFTPQGVTGRGIVHLFGLRTLVYGTVMISLSNRQPRIEIRELGVAGAAAPSFLIDAMTNELANQVTAVNRLPMRMDRLELQDGKLVVEGVFR